MSQRASDQTQLMSGLAALAACTVRTLSESEPTFQARWEKNLERAYAHLRDHGNGNLEALTLLQMTKDALRSLDQ